MFHTLAAGGWVMPFIVACSVIALGICIERHFALNKQRVAPPHLLASVWQQLRADGLDAQRLKSLRQGSPLGAILAAGLANRHQGREIMRESIREAAAHVIHRLERYLNALGTVAAISPLLGLLGTVMGMISVGFLAFMLFTSNPFVRILPFAPGNGADLNPLLQDPVGFQKPKVL